MPTRQFTREQLAALGVPPADPDEIQYYDDLLADEAVATLKYTQQRRVIFRADDGRTYAVEYETALDTGDFEVGDGGPDDYGWYGDTVEAVEVKERPKVVTTWEPVHGQGTPVDTDNDPVIRHLAEMYVETGCRDQDAQQYAAETLAQHTRELCALLQGERAAVYEDAGQRTAEGVTRAVTYLEAYARGLAPDA
ncbi:hypothetical protein AB0I84_06060 [Streptomyces spectabilis]|uniref:hypothetical protein n=1 Tax=Streptomyces spectabilis TaxID=68270 RepID=UPI0033D86A7E